MANSGSDRNIFCLEGDWTNNLKDRIGIKSGLEFLKDNLSLDYLYYRTSTKEEFKSRIKKSLLKQYNRYSIIYLAFHGYPEHIELASRCNISLTELAEIFAKKAQGKIIHFGSCGTMKTSKANLLLFKKECGALAVSGYTKEIDFMPSTFLDLLYFDFCQRYKGIQYIERDVKKYYKRLAITMGFKIIY